MYYFDLFVLQCKYIQSICVWQLFRTKGEEQEKAMKDCLDMLKTLEEQSNIGDKKFFGGENIGLMDLAFGIVAYWLGAIEDMTGFKIFEAQNFPRLRSWKERFIEVSEIKENLPNHDELKVFFKHRREMILAASPLN